MPQNLSAFDPIKFSAKVLERIDPLTLMLAYANRDYDGDLSENSTVKIRSVGDITLSPYVKGVTNLSSQDLSPTSEDFTVTDASSFQFAVDDVDARQNDLSAMDLYARRAAFAIADAIEKKIFAQYTKALAANQITGAAGANITLTKDNVYDNFVLAAEKLNVQNVIGGNRWMVVDPKSASAIALSPMLTRSTAMGDAIVSGQSVQGGARVDQYIGNIAGFATYWSNYVPSAGGARFITYGQGEPFNYAGQIIETEMFRSQVRFENVMRGLLLHDATVLSENKKKLGTIKVAP